jgi:hypothetical protein
MRLGKRDGGQRQREEWPRVVRDSSVLHGERLYVTGA